VRAGRRATCSDFNWDWGGRTHDVDAKGQPGRKKEGLGWRTTAGDRGDESRRRTKGKYRGVDGAQHSHAATGGGTKGIPGWEKETLTAATADCAR